MHDELAFDHLNALFSPLPFTARYSGCRYGYSRIRACLDAPVHRDAQAEWRKWHLTVLFTPLLLRPVRWSCRICNSPIHIPLRPWNCVLPHGDVTRNGTRTPVAVLCTLTRSVRTPRGNMQLGIVPATTWSVTCIQFTTNVIWHEWYSIILGKPVCIVVSGNF